MTPKLVDPSHGDRWCPDSYVLICQVGLTGGSDVDQG
jgi:hypothetical protein